MALRVSQETFHGAVVENMKEFDMPKEEALADAIEQFKQQGVDLSNLDTSGAAIGEDGTIQVADVVKHPMVAAAEELQTILTSMESKALDVVAFTALTDAIVKACIGSVENRSAFGDTGGLETFGHIAFIILSVDSAYPALAPLFDAVRCLCTKHDANRKRLSQELFSALLTCLHKPATDSEGVAVLKASLAAAAVICVKQEKYKRTLIKGDITPRLVAVLREHAAQPAVITEAVNVMKIITKDDDVVATASKAFDNSREFVAAGALTAAMELLAMYKSDPAMVPVVFGAVKHLACDDKTCQEITSEGGIQLILSILRDHVVDVEAASTGMSLLKTLAHSDYNKKLFCDPSVNAIGLMLQSLSLHSDMEKVLEHALTAVAVTALRHPDNCVALSSSGVFPLIAQAMRKHSDSIAVQRQACLALRNLVARNAELRPLALEEDIDPLLRTVRMKHPAASDVASAALRDLGQPYWARDGGDVDKDVLSL